MRLRRLLVVPGLGSLAGLVLVVAPTVQPPSSTPPPVRITSASVTAPTQLVTQGWSKVVDGTANLVGVKWQGDPHTRFTIEARDAKGHWSSAGSVGIPDDGPDPGTPEARRAAPGNVSAPAWVGDATAVRIRVANGSARGVSVQQVRSPRAPTSPNVAAAAAPAPAIISRAQWGANESLRLTNCPDGPDYDANVQLAIVHHTDGSTSYSPADSPAIMRGLYAYATQTLQYCDMHYNFLVDRFGQVFEGRYGGVAAPVHGAHAVGWNTNTTGIAAMGDFHTNPAPPAMVDAITRLIAWKFDVHGVDPTKTVRYVTAGNDRFPPGTAVTVPTVIGHQDTWFTDCPGQYLEPLLPQIRINAAAIMLRNRAWNAWQPLGAPMTSGPATASWAGNRLDVFSIDSSGSLVQKWWDGLSWFPDWNDLGTPSSVTLTGTPTAVSWGYNRIDVFATASDSTLRHRWWDGSGWSAWENLGGQLTSPPTVSSWGPGRLDVFARASDGSLQHKWWGTKWSDWEKLGGRLVGAPSAVSWAPNRVDVFARGTDNQLYHQWFGGRWNGWEPLGGALTAPPSAATWGPGRIDVFVRGSDTALWQQAWDGARWRGFAPQGGSLTSGPSAIARPWQKIDVFGRGTDAKLWRRAYG
jgi:hypothetical protein